MTGIGLIFGEVLFDCFPDGREVPGGAPFNVAWNLRALGMDPLFISRVGADARGEEIIRDMKEWSMTARCLQTDPVRPTGRVLVTLRDGEPHFDILPDQAFDHIEAVLPATPDAAAFLYHGSLALRSQANRDTLAELKKRHPCPVFIDVNLRDPWWNRDHILSLLEDADWLKLNEQEMAILFPGEAGKTGRWNAILDRFRLKGLFVTRGSRGATAVTPDDGTCSVAPAGSARVVDTVGAGDAFSSVLLMGLAGNWPMPVIMERAQDFASGVVSLQGATTRDRDFYSNYAITWNRP